METQTLVMRFPRFAAKAVTLSYDDGIMEDFPLIEIMERHGMRGTFNINSALLKDEDVPMDTMGLWKRMSRKQALELYRRDGIEVAVHGLTHEDLPTLPLSQVNYQVLRDREDLETLFGGIVRGMAYPYGTFSDAVVEALRASGIVYSRTVISSENFGIPTDWLRWEPTCHHKNPRLNDLTARFVEKQHGTREKPWLFYLWGHSAEFERDNNWEIIEQFAKTVGDREDMWYATNMEIYEYVEAYRSLVMSLDMKRFYNPTTTTLYFVLNGKNYTIAPAQTLVIE